LRYTRSFGQETTETLRTSETTEKSGLFQFPQRFSVLQWLIRVSPKQAPSQHDHRDIWDCDTGTACSGYPASKNQQVCVNPRNLPEEFRLLNPPGQMIIFDRNRTLDSKGSNGGGQRRNLLQDFHPRRAWLDRSGDLPSLMGALLKVTTQTTPLARPGRRSGGRCGGGRRRRGWREGG
jgi:hypothetical protein